MTMMAARKAEAPSRHVTSDSLIIHGLFAVTVVLLVASGITGWLEAHRAAPAAQQSALQAPAQSAAQATLTRQR